MAVDVYTLDAAAPSNMHTGVDKLFDAERRVKEARYEALCINREVLFFTFGMASMGRLGDSAEQFHSCAGSPTASRKPSVAVTCFVNIGHAGL